MSLLLFSKYLASTDDLATGKLSNNLPVNKLAYAMMAAMLVMITAGCSNNATETTTSNANSAQTQDANSTNNTNKAASKSSDPAVVKALQANLKTSGIEETIVSAVPTDMDGIYWVTAEGLPSFFADKAGKHIIQGQIIALGQKMPVDISAAFVANTAQEALKAVDKKEMIIYPAKGETKSVIYSFTDADCPYCTKLHEEMDEINALGVEVRYLAWPRSEQSIPKMEAVWCSEDRIAAMNQAKSGANISAPACNNPVAEHLALGASLGVNGTPAIFTESGQQIGGYLPAAQLAEAAIAN